MQGQKNVNKDKEIRDIQFIPIPFERFQWDHENDIVNTAMEALLKLQYAPEQTVFDYLRLSKTGQKKKTYTSLNMPQVIAVTSNLLKLLYETLAVLANF